MIIVCPRMDNTRGLNTSDCSAKIFNDEMAIDVGRYEDYFIYDLSFASNDFLRQRHKKTTWILA